MSPHPGGPATTLPRREVTAVVTYSVPRVGGRGRQDKLARQCQPTEPIVHLRQVVRASSEDRGRSARSALAGERRGPVNLHCLNARTNQRLGLTVPVSAIGAAN